MSIAEKFNTIAENEQKVYDAGYSQSELDFWNNFINAKSSWDYLFYEWGHEYIRPPFVITGSTKRNIRFMFDRCGELKIVEKKYFDLSNCKTSDTELEYANHSIFRACMHLKTIEDIGMKAGYYYQTFNNCQLLETIEVLRSNKTTMWNGAFTNCNNLIDIYSIEGEIGQNGFDVKNSTKLSHDTLMRIINALTDYSQDTTGTTWKVTLGATNLAKLTDAEKAIATQKGWTLS